MIRQHKISLLSTPRSATMVFYKLDENGTVDVHVFQNGNGQKVYFLAKQNLPPEYTFVKSQKASIVRRSRPQNKLFVFSFPLVNETFEEFDWSSLYAYNSSNKQLMFENGDICELAFENLIIVIEEKGNLEILAYMES